MLVNLMFISNQDMFFFITQKHNDQAHHPFNHQHHHLWKLQMSVCRVLQLFDRSVGVEQQQRNREQAERGREREREGCTFAIFIVTATSTRPHHSSFYLIFIFIVVVVELFLHPRWWSRGTLLPILGNFWSDVREVAVDWNWCSCPKLLTAISLNCSVKIFSLLKCLLSRFLTRKCPPMAFTTPALDNFRL